MQSAMRYLQSTNDHPLKHVWILDSTEETVETIDTVLNICKGLTRLTIDTNRILSFSLLYIRKRCQMRGVTLVETNGGKSSGVGT